MPFFTNKQLRLELKAFKKKKSSRKSSPYLEKKFILKDPFKTQQNYSVIYMRPIDLKCIFLILTF